MTDEDRVFKISSRTFIENQKSTREMRVTENEVVIP